MGLMNKVNKIAKERTMSVKTYAELRNLGAIRELKDGTIETYIFDTSYPQQVYVPVSRDIDNGNAQVTLTYIKGGRE